MQDKIQSLIYSSVLEILHNAHLKIPKLQEIHKNKIHFIPTKYRVLGGLLPPVLKPASLAKQIKAQL